MRISSSLPALILVVCLFPCGGIRLEAQDRATATAKTSEDATGAVAEVDALAAQIAASIKGLSVVTTIDHSRLAAKAGVPMPASIVTIYTDPSVNAPLMKLQPRLGIDLPCKVLACQTGDQTAVVYPTGEFLAKRHAVNSVGLIKRYDAAIDRAVAKVPGDRRQPLDGSGVQKDFGIVEMVSDFEFGQTIERLKGAVLSQGDTVWFGELDYQKEAAAEGVTLLPAKLLLFGGPGPGGKAMAQFPKLGLDAFCQKLLVYQDEQGAVRILFNDIVAFAELHYGKSNLPQKVINQRLTQTFSKTVTSQ